MQLDPHLAAIVQRLAVQAIALEQFQVDGFDPSITMLYQPCSAMLVKPLSKQSEWEPAEKFHSAQ